MGRGQSVGRVLPLQSASLALSKEQEHFQETFEKLIRRRKFAGVVVGEPGPYVIEAGLLTGQGTYENAEWIYASSVEGALRLKLSYLKSFGICLDIWQIDERVKEARALALAQQVMFAPVEELKLVSLSKRRRRLVELSQSVFGLGLELPQLGTGSRFAIYLDNGHGVDVRCLQVGEVKHFLRQFHERVSVLKGLYDLALPLGSARLPVTFSVETRPYGDTTADMHSATLSI